MAFFSVCENYIQLSAVDIISTATRKIIVVQKISWSLVFGCVLLLFIVDSFGFVNDFVYLFCAACVIL